MKKSGKKVLHIVGGKPWLDPDCPICRAHGMDAEMFPGGGGDFDEGLMIVEIMALEDMLRCDCPLCSRARR